MQRPPQSLLNGASLFLDFDGTLVGLVDRPDEVKADDDLRDLLVALHSRLNGRLAIISGRSLAQLDVMLGPVAKMIRLSGSHGSEHRWHGINVQPHRPAALDEAAARLRPFAERNPELLLEEKSFGVALHYRMNPALEKQAIKLAADVATDLKLQLQGGSMMIEVRIPNGGKDVAVRWFMSRPPMSGFRPVFIGDDLTDEAGFKMVAGLGGVGIIVGSKRETAAIYSLAGPAAVRTWLLEISA